MTQTAMLLQHLTQGQSFTVGEALALLGIYALSQRIGELKRQGEPIKDEWVSLPSGKRVKRYSWDYEQERVPYG